jgi:xanthine dehydrogenase accessory factor
MAATEQGPAAVCRESLNVIKIHGNRIMDIYHQIVSLLEQGQALVVATLVAREGSGARRPGARMIITGKGTTHGSLGGGLVDARTVEAAQRVQASGEPELLTIDPDQAGADTCGSRVRVFVEPVAPGPVVLIIGAGHVGRATAAAAGSAGLRVVLMDDRDPGETGAAHRPCRMEDVFRDVPVPPSAMVVISTRSHSMDYQVLVQALATPARFIGLLGSRRKRESFFARLRQEGVATQDLERIVTPVGLDIGARTPAEIAVSITAQLIAVSRESRP